MTRLKRLRPLLLPPTRSFVAGLVVLAGACGDDDATEADESSTGADETDESSTGTTLPGSPMTDPSASDSSSGGDDIPEPSCGANCSDPPMVLWQTTWGSGLWEAAFAAAVGPDGRFAVTGPVDWPPLGGFVLVYDADGAPVFSGMIPEAPSGLVWDSFSSFVIAGESPAGVLTLRRHDSAGAELWTRADGYVGSPGSLVRTDDGDLVVGGGAPTTGFIARFDAEGNNTSTVDTPIDMYISDLAVRGRGVAAIGVDINDLVWLGAYDGDGALQWSKPGPNTDAKAVAVTRDGSVIGAIKTASGGSALLRYDADGSDLPTVTLPWPESLVTDLLALPDGDVIVVTSVIELGIPHCALSRVNPEGVMTWGVSFASVANDSECVSIDVGPDDTLMISGTLRDATGDGDVWITRIATE